VLEILRHPVRQLLVLQTKVVSGTPDPGWQLPDANWQLHCLTAHAVDASPTNGTCCKARIARAIA
jgi:hypothetical protein